MPDPGVCQVTLRGSTQAIYGCVVDEHAVASKFLFRLMLFDKSK